MFNLTKIEKLTRTSFLTLIMAGTLLAKSGTAQTFTFSDFTFTRASACTSTSNCGADAYDNFKNKTFANGKKGAAAFQQFVQQESSAIDLATLDARKLDPTKLKLTTAKKLNIYFINEGAGYRNQLDLLTSGGTVKSPQKRVFYDGSVGTGANELRIGDFVTVGNNSTNSDVVKAGTTLDFQLRANGFDTNTNLSRASADVWYTNKSLNVDKLQHVIAYEYQGFLVLAWEDLKGGGDKDYNDIVFAVDIGQTNLDAIASEPSSNQPPNAKNDVAGTNDDNPINIDVLANDTDPENQALTITSATSLTGANVSLITENGKQKVKYIPNANYSGASDSFSYNIKDSQGATNSATVTVSLTAARPDLVNASEDNSVTGSVTTNDFGDNLTVTMVNGVATSVGKQITLASGALLTLNSNGTFTYNPNGKFESLNVGQTATDTFSYAVKNSQNMSSSANVTMTISGAADSPDAVDDLFSTDEDHPLATGNVKTNDTDPNGDAITVTMVNGNTANIGKQITLDSGALLTLNSDGTFDYNPNKKFESLNNAQSASDTFTYTIDDGNGNTDSATVKMTIAGVTDVPD